MLGREGGWNFSVNMIDIKHIKGKENKVADALNRIFHELHATSIRMYQSDLKDRILEATNSDL